MLDKIVVSQDRKEGRVYFDTHSVGFYHSEGEVVQLIWDIVIEPSIRLEQLALEKERQLAAALEDTKKIEIDPQLSLFDEKEAA